MPKITYVDKKPFIVNTSIPDENKISAEDMNQLKRVVNENEATVSEKSKVSLNNVRTDIELSSTRTIPTQANTVLVQLKDTTGKLCMVETVASQVFVKVGNDSVSLQRLLEISVYTEPPIAPKV